MKFPLFDDIDYVHRDHSRDTKTFTYCYWKTSFPQRTDTQTSTQSEFPLYMRRERFHRAVGVPTTQHDFFAFYIVRGGRGIRITDGFPHSVARGDVFLLAPKVAHSWKAPVDLTVDAIYFPQQLWTSQEWDIFMQLPDLATYLSPNETDLAKRGYTDHAGHLSPEQHSRVERVLNEMRREWDSGQIHLLMSARARLFTLLVQLAEWRKSKIFATRPARGAGISEVLNFCDNHFDSDISNKQLAELMHFSETHFRNVFTREVGMPPGAYIRHLRLQHAQELLRDKTLPLTDVARLCGYADATQLGRIIKKAFGVSPSQLRKNRPVASQQSDAKE